MRPAGRSRPGRPDPWSGRGGMPPVLSRGRRGAGSRWMRAMTTSFEALLPGTERALLHRVAVAQAEGRTPSFVGAVVRDGALVWSGSRSCVDGHAPDADT